MSEETSAGAPPRVQARGRDAAMQTETETRTDRTTRRRGESRTAGRPPDRDAIADQGGIIRVPVHMGEKIRKVNRTTKELAAELDREPTEEEVAQRLGWRVEDVARKGLTAPEVLVLALLALLFVVLIGLGSVFSFLYVLLILVVPGLLILVLWMI
jgi:hypothetical protein